MNTSGQQQGDLNAAKYSCCICFKKWTTLIKLVRGFKHLHPSSYQVHITWSSISLSAEDVRNLQDQLHMHGLSSLANNESHIRYQLQSILTWLGETFTSSISTWTIIPVAN